MVQVALTEMAIGRDFPVGKRGNHRRMMHRFPFLWLGRPGGSAPFLFHKYFYSLRARLRFLHL